jgi:hypothetical protein
MVPLPAEELARLGRSFAMAMAPAAELEEARLAAAKLHIWQT